MAGPSVVSTQAATVIANPFSGDYRIDVLLDNPNFRWNAPQALGSPIEVTYSFATAAPDYGSATDRSGFSVFNDAQKAAAIQAFQAIAQQCNITFREVPDTGTSYGQIRLGNNAQGATSAGYAYFPDPSLGPSAGDVYINNQLAENLSNVVPGTNAYATVVHEILHALGLKHPGNYNAGEPPQAVPGNFLAASEDSEANTILSYVKVAQGQERDFLGTYDLLALQYLYGSRPFNTGGSTYTLADTAGQRLQTIIDSSGVDTLNLTAVTAATTVDLREGASSSIGLLANGTPAISNVQIAFGTVVENVLGSSSSDRVTGNAAANTITGGGGNDIIDGGAGTDTAVFSGARSAYAITPSGSGWSVTDNTAGRDGTDTLTNVERVRFSDGGVALDVNGNAGTVARIIGAVFGASSVSNKQFVGIGLSLIDSGTSYQNLMQLALNARLGAGFGNDAEVSLLYQNVLRAAASPGDLATWTGAITSNQFTQVTLAMAASDSSINATNIQLVGLATTGVEYTTG